MSLHTFLLAQDTANSWWELSTEMKNVGFSEEKLRNC